MSPLDAFARRGTRSGGVVLDGGLATTLESYGLDLDDPLWSARVVLEDEAAVRRAHDEFLRAGADCISAATYQATIEGYARRGLDEAEAEAVMKRAVAIAIEARDAFWSDASNRSGRRDRIRPLVAASVGPYGAFLADGSEFTGAYDRDEDGLVEFHRRRLGLLASSGADLLACETVPSVVEACALVRCLDDVPEARAWISFSCRDAASLRDGTPLEEAVGVAATADGVVAVGLNCTAPEHISGLIDAARRATDKPVLVYPNGGGRYVAETRSWEPAVAAFDLVAGAADWRRRGAFGVGGCCRVGPAEIAAIRGALV